MKNSKKSLPIIISTIIAVVMIAVPFLAINSSKTVTIKAPAGSYAETFAKNNKIAFTALPDSENKDVTIPTKAEDKTEKTTAAENKTEEETTKPVAPVEKDNGTFTYNYVGETVTITGYKGINSVVEIPSEIDGLPVEGININTLEYNIDILQIPSSVTSIEGTFKVSRYTTEFYVVIAIIVLAYVFSIIATSVGMKKEENNEGTFYGIPFAYGGVVTLILLGIWCNVAIFAELSFPLTAIVSIVIFAFAVARLFMRRVVKEAIQQTGTKVKEQTQFIKLTTVNAQNLMNTAKSDAVKAECKKVYEALRYSDPMSNSALALEEAQITVKLNEFSAAVSADNSVNAKAVADEIVNLVNARNNKCMALK